MMTNRDAEWLLEMANINSEESEPRVIACRDDLRKEAAQVAMFDRLVDALETANQRLFDVGHGDFHCEIVLEEAKALKATT